MGPGGRWTVDGAKSPRQKQIDNPQAVRIRNYGIFPWVLFVILSQGLSVVITPSGKPVNH